ncbi:hypothetical protein WA026_008737 [Henosepilachna vigintioctopunctata]|uniref:DRBM domain-containing protein n=1 Tax=Henosepilachna vigintioctopunctata TaxID=420089 RepID=A0AAW1V9X0_9CUCU
MYMSHFSSFILPCRMGIQQMGPPPNQRSQPMLMSIQQPVPAPHTGVLVSMPQGPTLITTTSIPQAQKAPAGIQQVYHYDNGMQSEVMEQHANQQQQQQQHTEAPPQSSPNTNTSSGPSTNLANIKEKTPMCLVNELARYNKIQHQYRLTGEQGPAHKKTFTVTLKLGNEEYEAEGPSIKKAQHSAAAQALVETEFKHPPPKTVRNRVGVRTNNPGVVTPTVELNALAMKRGERTVYVIENGAPPQPYLSQANYYPRHNMYTPPQTRYGFEGRRPVRGHYQSYHDGRYYGQYRAAVAAAAAANASNAPQNHDPYTVRLHVGEREYPGVGYTVQAARHDAASKAIEDIRSMDTDSGEHNTLECVTPEAAVPPDLNTELKSPISLVHEIALKRNLNVTFEVLSEKGPPHMKVFVTRCHVGSFVAEGEGNGKKISKKRAAEKMLEELLKLPPMPQMNNMMQLKRKRLTNKKKTRNLIKMNVDKTMETVEEINPISRLIQIQQANKEREPVYTVLEERGAPRRREFVIEASVNGHSCTGVGPNKKVAKRNAAEALLSALGFASNNSILSKAEKETEPDKGRKVTFMEEKSEPSQVQVGGSGGRQLVPGLLLVGPQGDQFQQQKKENVEAKRNIPPPTIQGAVRAKDQLLYLAQLMNIQVQFSDFPKANHEMYLTLVSLSTTPPQVCHGEGPTTETSHEKASLEALKVLSELGLDIVKPSKDNSDSGKGTVNQNAVKK